MNQIEVGHTNVAPQHRRQSRRYDMAKAESVESLSYMFDADVRQAILDVGKALELASNDSIGKLSESQPADDEDEDACSITSELNHLTTLQQSIRDDMIKADDKYKHLHGRYISFDLVNDDTKTDVTDGTVDTACDVETRDSSYAVDTSTIVNTGRRNSEQPRRQRWRNSIQLYRASTRDVSTSSGTWNGRVSDWLLRATRKWWRRETSSKDSLSTGYESKVSGKSKDICKHMAAATKKKTLVTARKRQTSLQNGVKHVNNGSIVATELAVSTSSFRDNQKVKASTGMVNIASRMVRTLFPKKQTVA